MTPKICTISVERYHKHLPNLVIGEASSGDECIVEGVSGSGKAQRTTGQKSSSPSSINIGYNLE